MEDREKIIVWENTDSMDDIAYEEMEAIEEEEKDE